MFPVAMGPHEVLEAQVDVVTTLGDLVAAVALPDCDLLQAVFPRSLRAALRKFTWTLRCTLRHCSDTSLGQRDVTSLRQALATLEFHPQSTQGRAGMRAAARAGQDSVAALRESWDRLAGEATELQELWGGADTRGVQQPEVALELLGRLEAACDKASLFPWELLRRLGDIEAALEGTREVTPNVLKDLAAAVAEAERLWEASASLATRHLLGTLGDIRTLLSSPCGGYGGHAHCAVAARCQEAIEDIPRLLRGQ